MKTTRKKRLKTNPTPRKARQQKKRRRSVAKRIGKDKVQNIKIYWDNKEKKERSQNITKKKIRIKKYSRSTKNMSQQEQEQQKHNENMNWRKSLTSQKQHYKKKRILHKF